MARFDLSDGEWALIKPLLSMYITRAIGIFFPLIALIIFVFSVGNLACDRGNAPAAFC